MRHLVFWLLAWLLAGSVARAFPTVTDQREWTRAAEAMRVGDHQSALTTYGELLKSQGDDSAVVHYNFAVVSYRLKQLGAAVYHFRRAIELNPRDPDARFNLQYVRGQALDKIDIKEPERAWIRDYLRLTWRELWIALAAALVLTFGSAALLVYWRRDALLFVRRVALVAAATLALLAVTKAYGERPFGVVTAREAKVYSGFGKDHVLLFSLHEGAEFNLEEAMGDWLRIALEDGKKGWIRASDVLAQAG